MKKVILLFAALFMLGCHENLEERAARESAEYTRKSCPQMLNEYTTLDSTTFDIKSRTFNHYITLNGDADNQAMASYKATELHDALAENLKFDTSQKKYKDAGFSYKYIARSAKEKGRILFETTITKEEYQ